MNRVAQDFLVRPMGIFQLIDYVGIDVFQCIIKVMRTHLPDETLRSKLIDKMVKAKVLGGQYPDGSQKDGFLKYEKNRPVGVYDIRKKDYFEISEDWKKRTDKKLGPLPEGFIPWRGLLMDSNKDEKLGRHFEQLKRMDTLGAELACNYLKKTKAIANGLVSQGVAISSEDVNAVLMNGFFWLYGPINDYT
jgi:3-hydroxyacyl-CoA dehydrogenase